MAYLGKNKVRDMNIGAKAELFRLAKRKRNHPTEAERTLWNSIRKLRKEGFIFRRQHPIDFFIADFYCHKVRMIIEVDGDIHLSQEAKNYDENRTEELKRFGITILRFKNYDVLNDVEKVITEIKNKIKDLASPAHLGAGDGRG